MFESQALLCSRQFPGLAFASNAVLYAPPGPLPFSVSPHIQPSPSPFLTITPRLHPLWGRPVQRRHVGAEGPPRQADLGGAAGHQDRQVQQLGGLLH